MIGHGWRGSAVHGLAGLGRAGQAGPGSASHGVAGRGVAGTDEYPARHRAPERVGEWCPRPLPDVAPQFDSLDSMLYRTAKPQR